MEIPTKLRWGILGAARVNERLMPAIVEASNSELVAIASRRPGTAAETLVKYAPHQQGVRCYDQPEVLLADDAVQAVYLPMANHEHAEWAVRALQAGKHVLCEKPMALTAADIEAIATAARERGLTVMEGFMYRFHPQHARVQEIVRSGAIGEVRYARASYSFMMRPARRYRLARDVRHGGGAMWDIGPYAVHSLRWCFEQDPVAVTAMAKYVESGADIATSGVIDFGDGRRGHFDISFECARRSEYEITGTLGGVKCHTAWQNPGDIPVISWWTEDGRQCLEQLPVANHFRLEIEHFADCVLNGKPPLLSLDDARTNCRTLVAALESAASGRTVRLDA
ncbi:Gfo/Idh/MocA family protein [Methylococcus capsulatus]|uniref:Gfo/Idh/MocA family protein n=1 Tax=Methylococcus capsulatus TaxID=414 RepID=UPI0002FD31C8|nr:Gfo/Idh/MocA family oxidoreductase [Methylococcus capsulatus]